MRLRDVVKLQTGDIVTCNNRNCGCDGREYRVGVSTLSCGCFTIRHYGNKHPFVRRICPKDAEWGLGVNPHRIKLVRRAEG